MKEENSKIAIIIGAGPAGLTAALELLRHSKIKPIVLEMTNDIGGISKTVNYKGNRIDIGGHRFFSKSDVIMKWWQEIMPIELKTNSIQIAYQNKSKTFFPKKNSTGTKDVLLVRKRISRIFFLNKLFDYPLKLNLETLKKLGFILSVKISYSYMFALLFPIKKEVTLEDFLINRFGKKLYQVFFKDYTHKVWGVSCAEIPSEWGKQRIKKLNVLKAIKHALVYKKKGEASITQKNIETSLIEQFLYPKFGPGQFWEKVAKLIIEKGGEIHYNFKADTINHTNFIVNSISGLHYNTIKNFKANYIISTMPVKYLIRGLGEKVPINVKSIANNLVYRDFITVGLLVDKVTINNGNLKDNWIYIQEDSVKLGRLQIFNNWSPYMVKDKSKIWLGLEYFCNQGDRLWSLSDEKFIAFAIDELASIGIINKKDVIDFTIIKMPKTYPAYFGSYKNFDKIIDYTNKFSNLFLIGRNGMHKYNNQDHSMLTAIASVQNIITAKKDKSNIWSINTEEEYHEKK